MLKNILKINLALLIIYLSIETVQAQNVNVERSGKMSEEIYNLIDTTEKTRASGNFTEPKEISIVIHLRKEPTEIDKKNLTIYGGVEIEKIIQNIVYAKILNTDLYRLEKIKLVKFIRLPEGSIENSFEDNTSITISELIKNLKINKVQNIGYTGKRIKITVIDKGFDLSNLPQIKSNNTFSRRKSDFSIKGDEYNHGTAIAEIISSIAPDAEISLITIDNKTDYLGEIIDSINDAVIRFKPDIIATSTNFMLPLDFFDGTNIISKFVDKVNKEKGTVFIFSAGNNALKNYRDNFLSYENNFEHNFNYRPIHIPLEKDQEITLVLSWGDKKFDDPIYYLQMYLTDQNNSIKYPDYKSQIFSKEYSTQKLSFKAPFKSIYSLHLEGIRSFEKKVSGKLTKRISPDELIFRITLYSKEIKKLEYFNPKYSLDPNLSVTSSALVVGALDGVKDKAAEYSSRGPREKGLKPDFMLPSGIQTKSIKNFNGTSASVPVLAGIVALMKEKNNNITSSNIKDILKKSIKTKISNWNYIYGFGSILDVEEVIRNVHK